MCAITAARRGKRVLVLEHGDRVGKKILISGGGRCNFTNLHVSHENYLSAQPDFCKSALARFTPRQMVEWVESHAIPWHEKKLGQLFCDDSSKRITEMLRKECRDAGVEISLSTAVLDVTRGDVFQLDTNQGKMTSRCVVVATGGLSFPKLGTSNLGAQVAKKLGLKVMEQCPALVPLLFSDADLRTYGDLSGISLDVAISCGKKVFRENLLFTHRGMSGPAVLQISSYWKEGMLLQIDLSPDEKLEEWLLERRQEKMELANVLSHRLPRRFIHAWCERFAPSQPMNRFPRQKLREISHALHHWEIIPAGTEGYEKAEVTRGGVCTSELSSRTMEARKIPGLYFIGEVVDVTGHLGGFNFQWAWASGFAAGESI